jgi:hypothetical protein
MAEGQLRCAGSALFLKKMYGVGYQLTVEKNVSGKSKVMELNQQVIDDFSEDSEVLTDPVSSEPRERRIYDVDFSENSEVLTDPVSSEPRERRIYDVDDDCDDETPVTSGPVDSTMTDLVKRSVPEATLLNDVGTEVRYQLPIGSSEKFAAMFEQLDREVDQGNIVSYGVSITTLGTLTSFSSALLFLVANNKFLFAHTLVSFDQRKCFCWLPAVTLLRKVKDSSHHRNSLLRTKPLSPVRRIKRACGLVWIWKMKLCFFVT